MTKGSVLLSLASGALVACAAPDAERGSTADAEAPSSPSSGRVEVVGEGVISTSMNQTFPAQDPVTGDLWFSVYEDSFDAQTTMVSRRTETGWAVPETASFSGTWGDRAPRFSPDGSRVYITSNRPRSGSDGPGDTNIWSATRTNDGWSELQVLETEVNTEKSDMHVSITRGAIWVASDRAGGRGRLDLYRILQDGSVEHPGPRINDERSQPDVWVSPDESWMILVMTDHPDGYGGDDLYVSRREDGEWGAPVNLGPEINTPEYEYGPWVSADGETLFFTSHRDGPAHVYRVGMQLVRQALAGR